MTVLIYENFATESVVIEGLVRSGSLAEMTTQAGLASMTAALLMRGTELRSFEEIYDALESVGAELAFGSGYHNTSFSGQGLVEDLDLLLELVAQSLRQPTFPQAQVEQMRGQIMTGLQMRASDTGQMALLSFREALYQQHPYGRSQRGYDHTIPTITRDHIAHFHRTHFGPKGMIVTIVGAVKAADALAKVEAMFGDWQVSAQQIVATVPDAVRPERVVKTAVSIPDKSQADLVIDKATHSILQEIRKIQNELVSPAELVDSQTYRIGSMPVGLETNGGMADVITDMELYELGLDYLLHYPDLIRDINPERIQAAAQKYLSSEQVVVAVAGPSP